ncbi:hypothetical protein [Lysinibacillus sphaericus]|nr:hypothetical protein [Lysinibacillus sphaericus]
MNHITHMEDVIQQLYAFLNITKPEQLQYQKVARHLKIELFY